MSELIRQRELFEAALALAPAQRADFVRLTAADDSELCGQVLALLAADQASMASDAAPARADAPADPIRAPLQKIAQSWAGVFVDAQPQSGQQIGPYQVTAEIGRGGMGAVLRAERADGHFVQTVAIKVISGIDDDAARARFARERALLAKLNHPHIAKLLDGGRLANGAPYLVMEYVAGEPLTQWLAQHKPSLSLRLEVFRALCDAVHHAHQHLIVHRDLKPANVLIDAENRPKLLDFGIARLVDQSIGEHVTTQRMMTLAYASPEQLLGGAATTASDVHGLGLLLYELLVGEPMRSARDTDDFSNSTNRSLVRISKKPSAQARLAQSQHLRADAARLKGDLDHIVLKCTRIEPGERYVSAAAIALDVSRYLQHRPLDTRRGEWRYAAWKLIRRNPFAIGTLACSILALLWFGAQLKLERDRAQTEAMRATEQASLAGQTTRYLIELFKAADPAIARGQDISARAVLDRGYAQLLENGADNRIDSPAQRAKLFATFGEIYLEIGMPEPALAGLENALKLLPKNAPALERAWILENLSNAQTGANQVEPALQSAEQALAIYEAQLGPNRIEVARALIRTGIAEQSKENFDAAFARFERARQIASALPNERAISAEALQYLGIWAVRTRQAARGEHYLRQALALKQAHYGEKHPSTLDALQALVVVLGELGDIAAWDASSKALAKGRKALHGPDSSPYFQALFARCTLQVYALKLRDAEATSRTMVEGFAKLSAEPLFEDFLAYASLANVLAERGELSQAIAWQRRAIAGFSASGALHSAIGIRQRYRLARMLILDGQRPAAQAEAQTLLTELRSTGKADGVEALETQLLLQTLSAEVDAQIGEALLNQIATLRGAKAPVLLQHALDLTQGIREPQHALHILQRWQPRAQAIRLFEAKFALAIAERCIALRPNSTAERAAAKAQLAPFIVPLRTELLATSPLIARLDWILR